MVAYIGSNAVIGAIAINDVIITLIILGFLLAVLGLSVWASRHIRKL